MKKSNKYVVLIIDSIPNHSKSFISGGYNNSLANLSLSINEKNHTAIKVHIEELLKAKKNNSISFEYMAVANVQTHETIANPDEAKLILEFNRSIANTELTRLAEFITTHLDSIQATQLFDNTTQQSQANQIDSSQKIEPTIRLPNNSQKPQADNLQELTALKRRLKRRLIKLEQFYQKNCLLFTDEQRENIAGFLQDCQEVNWQFVAASDLKKLIMEVSEFKATVYRCQKEALAKNTVLDASINEQAHWLHDFNPHLLNSINQEQRNNYLTNTANLTKLSYQQKLRLLDDITIFNQLLYKTASQDDRQVVKHKVEPAIINKTSPSVTQTTHRPHNKISFFYGSLNETSLTNKQNPRKKQIQIISDKTPVSTQNSRKRFFNIVKSFLCCAGGAEESLPINHDEAQIPLFRP